MTLAPAFLMPLQGTKVPCFAYVKVTEDFAIWLRDARERVIQLQAWDPRFYSLEIRDRRCLFLRGVVDDPELKEDLDMGSNVMVALPFGSVDGRTIGTDNSRIIISLRGIRWAAYSMTAGYPMETSELTWIELGLT